MAFTISYLEERQYQSIVRHISNILYTEFLLFSIYSSCWTQYAKSRQDVQTHERVIHQRALLE